MVPLNLFHLYISPSKNPLCCIAPVSLDRGDRGNPPPLMFDGSVRSNGFRQVPSAADTEPAANRQTEEAALAVAATEGRDSKGCCSNNGVIAGILYKWVNYGKGWRSRWFVLQDGVLSYYKIHGPDKISVGAASEKGVRVIGEDSLRYMRKHAMRASTKRWKPFGEIHLKLFQTI